MHPGEIAAEQPNKPAYIMARSGQIVTYGELEACANQGAHLFRSLGLKRGGHIAIMLENHSRFLQICWAAQRAGLYYTPVSWRLQNEEVAYIVNNCEAQVFITSAAVKEVVQPLLDKTPNVTGHYMVDGVIDGFLSFEEALAEMPETPIPDQSEGALMPYSSGTTGYPKGIQQTLSDEKYGDGELFAVMTALYGATKESVFLSPAPLYHSAPLGFSMTSTRHGITVVIMEDFEAEFALECIQSFQITHSQWVPTMFVRMLKLSEEIRSRYDVSSLQYAIHGAAPCPVPIKGQMIEWWGEVLYEYYAGSEANGFVQLNSSEWLAHKGSVGRPMACEIHICDDSGAEVATGKIGNIYFGGGNQFEYYKEEEKTAGARDARGWSTLGDVGYLDEDGYLYLTDRQHFMIISGGVNIYPQEAENVLIMHKKVMDVAVFGIPNEEFGEEVKAAVQLADPSQHGESIEAELLEFCRAHLSHIKCPRSIDFHNELPRHPTGKLYKRLLKDEYWAN
ncbi:MAG: acyl-CoA synthetase (AMP-forming)/AMP-acid ligase II [Alcanivorax sp.]